MNQAPQSKPVAVLGAGSWGTALAILLARNGIPTRLWGRSEKRMAQMSAARENSYYLPGIAFPEALQVHDDLSILAKSVDQFLLVVPCQAFRETLEIIKPSVKNNAQIAWATKGLEPGSSKLLSAVFTEVMGETVPAAAVSGPTFAREVAQNLPMAIAVASRDHTLAETVAGWLRNERVRVYTCSDIIGVQLGGAIKNVIAIATGISDGLGFGANARVALITRGLAELTRLGLALGGDIKTFMGLTGVGDLILTCTDDQSRNRRVGIGLGQGRELGTILDELGQHAAGVSTAREVLKLAGKAGVEMPITEQTVRVLQNQCSPQEAVEALLSREPRAE